jgi:cell wall-associated NlpC family hydrolase
METAKPVTRDQIVAAARELLGTRFRHQGRRPGRSLDCVGVARDVGITLKQIAADYDFRAYGRLPDPLKMRTELDSLLDPIELRTADAGDVILISSKGWSIHLGILARGARGQLTIIHTTKEVGRCFECDYEPEWRGSSRMAFRYRGVSD